MSDRDLPVRDEIARIDGNIEGILTRLGQQGESVARLDLLVEEMKEMNQQLEHIKIRLNTLEGRIE
jgi:archaellum component FlaC